MIEKFKNILSEWYRPINQISNAILLLQSLKGIHIEKLKFPIHIHLDDLAAAPLTIVDCFFFNTDLGTISRFNSLTFISKLALRTHTMLNCNLGYNRKPQLAN